jgi:hypothetical protein
MFGYPEILINIGKETHDAILDLGSSVSVLSKELYDLLELKTMEKMLNRSFDC